MPKKYFFCKKQIKINVAAKQVQLAKTGLQIENPQMLKEVEAFLEQKLARNGLSTFAEPVANHTNLRELVTEQGYQLEDFAKAAQDWDYQFWNEAPLEELLQLVD